MGVLAAGLVNILLPSTTDLATYERNTATVVIFINRYFYPDHAATSQLLGDLAFSLAAGGREIHVITSRQRYHQTHSLLPRREHVRGVEIHRVWSTHFGRSWLPGRAMDYLSFYTSAGWCLFCLARRGHLVVAKTDPPLISTVAAGIARLRGARLVNWLQDLFPEVASASGLRLFRAWPGRLLQALRNGSLRAAAMNVALDTRMAAYLQRQGIPARQITVIHNWADGQMIQPVAMAQNPLRQEWQLQGQFVVGYSGNLGRVHEFQTMLGAMQALREQRDIVFLFIGAGHAHQSLQAAIKERGLQNVRFLPYQPRERLSESLSVPDVHLVSLQSDFEGFVVPSKFYGIAAAGRPVLFIGAGGCELAQLVHQEQCGSAIREGDSEALVAAILALRDNPAKVQREGQKARTLLLQRFDQSHCINAWQTLLDDLSCATGDPEQHP